MKASKPPGLTNSQVSIRAGRFFRRLCVGCGQESPSVAANRFLPEQFSHCARCAWEPEAFLAAPAP